MLSHSYHLRTPLLAQAFAPVPVEEKKQDQSKTEFFAKIYGEPVYDGEDITVGTLVAEQKCSAEEQKRIDRLNVQIAKLVTYISDCKELNLTKPQLDNLQRFSNNFQSRNKFKDQTKHYYAHIKAMLEDIALALTHPLISGKTKAQAMRYLTGHLNVCSGGIFFHIQKAAQELTVEQDTIVAWLAALRERIFNELVESHILRKNISEGNSMHAYIKFFSYCHDNQFNIPGDKFVHLVNDESDEDLAKIEPEDLENFYHGFLKRYNASAIVTHLAEVFHNKIYSKLKEFAKKENYINGANFDSLVKHLPIVKNERGLFFDSTEKSSASPESPVIQWDDCYFKLKSVGALRRSLTQYVERDEDPLFDVHTVSENQSQYFLVPRTAELCFVLNSKGGDIWPLDQKDVVPMELSEFKTRQIPINQGTFEYSLHQEEKHHAIKDFSDCVFGDIDLKNINLSLINIIGAEFEKMSVTPDQYIYLTRQNFSFPERVEFSEKQVEEFLNQAKITGRDYSEMLTHAAKNNHLNAVRVFMSVSKKSIFLGNQKNYALHFAVLNNNPDMVKLLLETGGVDASLRNKKAKTAVQLAYEHQYWECFYMHLSLRRDQKGVLSYASILLDTVKKNNHDLAARLVLAGANCGYVDHETGNSSLHFAVLNNNPRIVEMLVSSPRTQVDLKNKQEKTALELAYEHNYWECVKAHAYEVVRCDQRGGYVLHFLARRNDVVMMKLLLESGIDASLENKDHETAIELAAKNEYWDWVKTHAMMRRDDAGHLHYSNVLLAAAKKNKTGVVKALLASEDMLLAKEAQHTPCDPDGNDALHLAVINNSAEMVADLLKAGVNIFLENKNKETAIQLAYQNNYSACIEAFEGYRDSQGNGILHLAVLARAPMVEILVKTGVEIELANDEKQTAIELAFSSGRRAVCLSPFMRYFPGLVKQRIDQIQDVHRLAAMAKSLLTIEPESNNILILKNYSGFPDLLGFIKQRIVQLARTAGSDFFAKDDDIIEVLSVPRRAVRFFKHPSSKKEYCKLKKQCTGVDVSEIKSSSQRRVSQPVARASTVGVSRSNVDPMERISERVLNRMF